MTESEQASDLRVYTWASVTCPLKEDKVGLLVGGQVMLEMEPEYALALAVELIRRTPGVHIDVYVDTDRVADRYSYEGHLVANERQVKVRILGHPNPYEEIRDSIGRVVRATVDQAIDEHSQPRY